jgi:SSS family solute:Na+ symporter
MFSIIISTIDSFVFVSGLTIGRDLISSGSNESDSIFYTKIGIAVSALISVILATFFENAIDIWYVSGSFGASALLIPMLCCLYKRQISHPFLLILIPVLVTGSWFLFGHSSLDPLYPGILSSAACYLLLRK